MGGTPTRDRLSRLFLTASALATVGACTPSPPPRLPQAVMVIPTTVPSARIDENSRIAHAQLLEKARAGTIDVYFVGDSITRRWGALDYPEFLEHWNATFFGWNAANFAWGGDRTQNILWRLENGELDGVSPEVFVVQAGTNNLGDFENDAEHVDAITAGITAIVRTSIEHAPDATVVLTGVFPRRDRPEFNPVIESINAQLAALADGDRIRFIDISESLSDDDGLLLESVSTDGLHLELGGFRIWAEALVPILTELLGPPSNEDAAPPPTGNPEAG